MKREREIKVCEEEREREREGERKKKNHERGNRQNERHIVIEMEREKFKHIIHQKFDLVPSVQSISPNVTYVPHPVDKLEISQQQRLEHQILEKTERETETEKEKPWLQPGDSVQEHS